MRFLSASPTSSQIRACRSTSTGSLSPQQSHPLNILASGGFAMIFDPSVAIDVSTESRDVELAVFAPSAPNRDPIAALGQNFSDAWFDPTPQGTDSTFLDGGYLVTSIRSAKWDISVLTATPQYHINQRIGHYAVFFVPIGALCGAILAFMVRVLSRLALLFPRNAPPRNP
jgi:sensor c-di-GMP phosphodiesterase-like protein